MPTDVNPVSSDGSSYAAKREVGGFAKNDFLRLLTTQLQHQDPLNPASQEDMLANLAQFTALEQTGEMNTNMAALVRTTQWNQGLSLLGKTVAGVDVEGASVVGPVTNVRFEGDALLLRVEGKDIPLTSLREVVP